MMCQDIIISCNKCAILVRNVDNEGGYACMEQEEIWEICIPFCQFSCESKTALKTFLKKLSKMGQHGINI